jgi:protocatechuate 3,4-dioxygenase alpha subunit
MTAELVASPSQTAGPLWGFALMFEGCEQAVDPATPSAVVLRGRVLDGDGRPVAYPDALLEVWSAEQWARARTDEHGWFRFVVAKPAPSVAPDGRPLAPHLHLAVFARGLLKHVLTRVYFPDEEEANAADPVLELVAPEDRRTLIARADGAGLVFDVVLQGEDETVFFAY